MKLARMDVLGNPFIGIFCAVNDSVAAVPPGMPKHECDEISEILDVDVVRTTIGAGTIIGSILAMNNKGAVVIDYIYPEEMKKLKRGFGDMNIEILGDRHNAAGNNILANDRCAIVHPEISKEWVKRIGDALGVEVVQTQIGEAKTPGSAATVTNKGCLCHPKASQEQISKLKEFLKVETLNGTINHGSAMIGAGLIANTKGAIAGSLTTGIELARIEEALGFLEG